MHIFFLEVLCLFAWFFVFFFLKTGLAIQPPESRWAFPQSFIPVSAGGQPIQSLLPLSLHMLFPYITHPLAYKSGHDLEGLPSWAFL